MKILHLSDLHLGKRLLGYDLIEDQRYILGEIIKSVKENKPELILICGDVFDRANPSEEAVKLYDDFTGRLTELAPVFIIAGNHDSAVRLQLYKDRLKDSGLYIEGDSGEGLCHIDVKTCEMPVRVHMLSYVSAANLGSDDLQDGLKALFDGCEMGEGLNILLSHQFFLPVSKNREEMIDGSERIKVGGAERIDSGILSAFDYVALGHVHRCQKAGKNAYYSGSPLKYAVDESEKVLLYVEIGPDGFEVKKEALKPLREVRTVRGSFEEILEQEPSEDYVFVKLTDTVPVYGAKRKLQKIFPNILGITVEGLEEEEFEDIKTDSPLELLELFFKSSGRDLSPKQREIAKSFFSQI